MPVIMPERAGAHTGAWEKAWVYRMAWVAKWSKLGVCASGSP